MKQFAYFLWFFLCASQFAHAFHDTDFYRANNLFYEPRLEKDYLTTLNVHLQGGSTSKGRNACHETVPLFDIFGTSDMHELAVGVPCKDLSNPLDVIIQQLSMIPSRCYTSQDACEDTFRFANYSISADFDIFEAYLAWVQNISHGFFIQVDIPIKRMRVCNICFADISPTTPACPNINTPIWKAFKNNFQEILDRWDICCQSYTKSGLGDIAAVVGWTHSFQDTKVLDFVDTTIRFGVVIPSGEEANPDRLFSISFGYDKHTAALIDGSFAFGVYEWLSIGSYFDVLVFGSKTRCVRVKTGLQQSGIIKLAKTEASVEKGPLWQVGAYIKADHFARGLSLLFGYSFASKNSDCITPCDTEKFCPSIINSDQMIQGWKMHTINMKAEYDFAREGKMFGPRVAFYYNRPVGGKRYFTTGIIGGEAGLEIAWDF